MTCSQPQKKNLLKKKCQKSTIKNKKDECVRNRNHCQSQRACPLHVCSHWWHVLRHKNLLLVLPGSSDWLSQSMTIRRSNKHTWTEFIDKVFQMSFFYQLDLHLKLKYQCVWINTFNVPHCIIYILLMIAILYTFTICEGFSNYDTLTMSVLYVYAVVCGYS